MSVASDLIERRWIPVTESLPENHIPVETCGDVSFGDNRTRCAYYIGKYKQWASLNDTPSKWTVTHWMPMLPLPPQEDITG